MSEVTVYGASDDLVEIEGDIVEEFNWNAAMADDDERRFLAFSDGTVIDVRYDGFWRFTLRQPGSCACSIKQATDISADYSDKVTLSGEIHWVVFGDAYAMKRKNAR